MHEQRKLVLFDFDGTITSRDTLFEVTRMIVGLERFLLGVAWVGIPMMLHKLGLVSSQRTKEIFLTHFFSGMKKQDFESECRRFSTSLLPGLIRPSAMEAINFYRKQGVFMLVVSASAREWIEPWASQQGMQVIGTHLEVKDGRLTGKIDGKNCNGFEKVNRIVEYLKLGEYDEIIAYGDSAGDGPMLELASTRFYRPFRE